MPWVWTKRVFIGLKNGGGARQFTGDPKKFDQDYNIMGPKQIL